MVFANVVVKISGMRAETVFEVHVSDGRKALEDQNGCVALYVASGSQICWNTMQMQLLLQLGQSELTLTVEQRCPTCLYAVLRSILSCFASLHAPACIAAAVKATNYTFPITISKCQK